MLLQIKDLRIEIRGERRTFFTVDGLSLSVPSDKTAALVGESGCGKSITALSILRLLPKSARVVSGQILFEGQDLLSLGTAALRGVRGGKIGFVFQEPMTALNPVLTVGRQIEETLEIHAPELGAAEIRRKTVQMLGRVGIDAPEMRYHQFPHELSGGMRQRVVIAMALICHPKLLIADEPTTALDVTIQAQILSLLKSIQKEFGLSILLITHDLGVVSEFADTISVMRAGKIVEEGGAQKVLGQPQHTYTQSLIQAIPGKRLVFSPSLSKMPLLQVRDLRHTFQVRSHISAQSSQIQALKGVSIEIYRGETLGIVGESGSGKSTLGRCVLNLLKPESGEVVYDTQSVLQLSSRQIKDLRKKMQIVFQDPYSSLNPRMTVGALLLEPLIVHTFSSSPKEREKRVEHLLFLVGLPKDSLRRYPHEFSGGQRQRIGIARALAVQPEFIVCDEPVSALDVSIQAQIMKLLLDLQKELKLTYLFISHDLRVIRSLCHRVCVMKKGEVVESGECETVFTRPQHPYTSELLSAIPKFQGGEFQ